METKNTLIVLSRDDDPQFAMLKGLPHMVCSEPAGCAKTAAMASVILNWSANSDFLRPLLETAPNVRWIHSRSAGLEDLLFPELVSSDVVLTNGSGVFSSSLGEFVLGAILFFAKDFRRMIRNQSAEIWEQFNVDEIAGQTVGIVGYGDIGRAVATRVRAMGMRVMATKRHVPKTTDPLVERYFKPAAQRDMLALCDYVVVTAPLTEETHHMISHAEFSAMKSSAVIINVGRGPVIDEAAMLQALSTKRIRGAGLDVFEHEPLLNGDPFYRLENVLLSPHCADHTAEWKNDAMRFFLEQYARFEKGEALKNVVNKQLGY
jgi:phosphoglycerate dehydrogenase-like enzyme